MPISARTAALRRIYVGAGSDYERGWRDYSPSRVQQAFVRGDWRPDEDHHVDVELHRRAWASCSGTQIAAGGMDRHAARRASPGRTTSRNHSTRSTCRVRVSSAPTGRCRPMPICACRRAAASTPTPTTADSLRWPRTVRSAMRSTAATIRLRSASSIYAGVAPAYDPSNPAATINNVPASNVLGNVHTRGYGGSLQAVNSTPLAGHDNQFTVGVEPGCRQQRLHPVRAAGLFSARSGATRRGDRPAAVRAGHADPCGRLQSQHRRLRDGCLHADADACI